jgi:hypothetical protein
MQPKTVATMDRLEDAAWFSRVGVHDSDVPLVLSSWQEAVEHCSSAAWKDLCLEAANQYSERLFERSPERFHRWNEIATEVRAVVIPLVSRKIEAVVAEHHLPIAFEHSVRWDMIHLCMESEYADVYPPGFYASHAYWYVQGHFPCGWQGEFPKDGRLIVY